MFCKAVEVWYSLKGSNSPHLSAMNRGESDTRQLPLWETPSSPNAVQNNQHITQELPDGGYGWICVMAQFFINAFTWGVAAVIFAIPTRP